MNDKRVVFSTTFESAPWHVISNNDLWENLNVSCAPHILSYTGDSNLPISIQSSLQIDGVTRLYTNETSFLIRVDSWFVTDVHTSYTQFDVKI